MKILLVAVALLAVIEARAYNGWQNFVNVPGFGNGRGNGQILPWTGPPQNYQQNNGFNSNSEWVCRNSKTGDTTVFIFYNTPQQTPDRGSWQWQNIPSEHHKLHHENGNHWTQPIFVQNPTGDNNDKTNQPPPQTTPTSHGGEGLIDIRLGEGN